MVDRMPLSALTGGQPLPPDTPITPGVMPGDAPGMDAPMPMSAEEMQNDPIAQLIFLLLQDPEFGPLIVEALERRMAGEPGEPPAPGPAPDMLPIPPMPPMGAAPPPAPPAPGGQGPFTQALLNRR